MWALSRPSFSADFRVNSRIRHAAESTTPHVGPLRFLWGDFCRFALAKKHTEKGVDSLGTARILTRLPFFRTAWILNCR